MADLDYCAVCERVAWGYVVRLGFGKWRHAECYPGSAAWLDYFKRLPASQQTEEGIMLRKFHESTPQNAVERDEN